MLTWVTFPRVIIKRCDSDESCTPATKHFGKKPIGEFALSPLCINQTAATGNQDKGEKLLKDMKTKRQIRYAVVGLGHLAQVAILPAFANTKNSQLVALVSGDPKKQYKMARMYDAPRLYSYDQYEECLAHDVDAVYIVLPNHMHRNFAVRALKAGVHVLCEKPMAVTSKECREMMATARDNKCKLMIAYRLHFEKANLEAINLIRRDRIGKPRFFSSQFAQQVAPENVRMTEPVKRGGGPIYDMGVYCINAARYLFGAEPIEVLATSASMKEPRFRHTEEMTSVVLRFPEERLATFTASFGAADIGRYTLVGTKGTLTADPAYEYAEGLKLQLKINEKTRNLDFPKRDQFAAEISYFSDCILKNREPEPSGEEGLADVRIVEAIYESARSGKLVHLPAFDKRRRPTLAQEIHRPAHGKPQTVKVESPSGQAA
jgi:predicted dehydrogenase